MGWLYLGVILNPQSSPLVNYFSILHRRPEPGPHTCLLLPWAPESWL